MDAGEEAEVKKGMLKWFREKVIWGSIKVSVLPVNSWVGRLEGKK